MKVTSNHLGRIEDEAGLTAFLEREVSIPFQSGQFFFRVFALEDYKENESVLLVKFHHSLADGMGLMGLCASLQDEYFHQHLYEFAPSISCCKLALMWLIFPFSLLYELANVIFMKRENNLLSLSGS